MKLIFQLHLICISESNLSNMYSQESYKNIFTILNPNLRLASDNHLHTLLYCCVSTISFQQQKLGFLKSEINRILFPNVRQTCDDFFVKLHHCQGWFWHQCFLPVLLEGKIIGQVGAAGAGEGATKKCSNIPLSCSAQRIVHYVRVLYYGEH